MDIKQPPSKKSKVYQLTYINENRVFNTFEWENDVLASGSYAGG